MKRNKNNGPCGNPGRRRFLTQLAGAGATATIAAAIGGCQGSVEGLLSSRFAELTPDEVQAFIKKLERDYQDKYKKAVAVAADPPLAGVEFGYGLDLSRCIGCRRCVHACVDENNQSRDPEIQWIRVLEMAQERGVDLAHSNAYYDHEEVPAEGYFYMPVACMQCENPPCTKVCPVKATWTEPDGITVVDYNWCIGCRYCMAACPYGARRFNWKRPQIDPEQLNTETHVLGNRPRDVGVVEKCTFCIQRTRRGLYPTCVEVCPVGARKFGNLLDPASEIRYVMKHKRVFLLKEELNTGPRFFYFYAT
jgi:molybdopterin-containing oxidoreductase family iron-sulfur binding subunit